MKKKKLKIQGSTGKGEEIIRILPPLQLLHSPAARDACRVVAACCHGCAGGAGDQCGGGGQGPGAGPAAGVPPVQGGGVLGELTPL